MMQFSDEQQRFIDEHYQPLPKDADGEYIRIGDVMEYADNPTELLTVSHIELEKNGWWVFADGMGRRSDKYRHHHAPTVEDVLREFAGTLACADNDWGSYMDNAIAEYAAKLRLAGDAE